MKRSDKNLLHLICFILFVIWGVGTLISIVLNYFGATFSGATVVERILNICAMLVWFTARIFIIIRTEPYRSKCCFGFPLR